MENCQIAPSHVHPPFVHRVDSTFSMRLKILSCVLYICCGTCFASDMLLVYKHIIFMYYICSKLARHLIVPHLVAHDRCDHVQSEAGSCGALAVAKDSDTLCWKP